MRRFLTCLAFLLLAPASGLAQNPDYPPIKGYVSIEPFSLREEMVIRLDVVESWLGIETTAGISQARAKEITKALAQWIVGKNQITVEGIAIPTRIDQVNFVRPDPEKGLIVDDRDLIPSATALIGTVAGAALDGPPAHASVTWTLFPNPPESTTAVVEIGTRKERSARVLTPANATIDWKGDTTEPAPTFLDVPTASVEGNNLYWITGSVVGLVVLARLTQTRKFAAHWTTYLALFLGIIAVLIVLGWTTQGIRLSQQQANEIVYSLLRNTYHAFNFREEGTIYDALERSISGDLLEQVYLEVTNSLQLESQGGARVRIIDVDLRETLIEDMGRTDFEVRLRWVAIGEITHWGHTHKRVNQYTADASITAVDSTWKFAELTLANEERM